ncbi:MAG TPA: glycerate kinase [Deltaproteobacteria bacterium]|jgi:hydroxypyruvate reductase|nr:glycerate kinase [Deltaproteobacteria bacterium]HQM21379.1 glycerate kinase [Deltaproteobacteria bacterium]HRC96846.1 glycerate kinase [Deltaproteobacteria bacterium]
MNPENDMRAIFSRALERVDPYEMIKNSIAVEDDTLVISHNGQTLRENLNAYRDIVAIGIGKASSKMGAAVEDILKERLSGGIVVTKYGHAERLKGIQVIEAGHPIPDENSVAGAEAIYRIASRADENTLIINLISGGGSSLLSLPAEGVTLGDKQETTRVLLESGADIREINCVRKHISRVKGGRFAHAAFPARMINIILSDVVGDRLDSIASGIAVPDDTTYAQAVGIVDKYRIRSVLPASVVSVLESGKAGKNPDTPKQGDHVFDRVLNILLGNNLAACRAARDHGTYLGYRSFLLTSMLTGEAREAARFFAAVARDIRRCTSDFAKPALVVSGGETTVTVKGDGKGGRNQEMALSFLNDFQEAQDDMEGIHFLSAGTDGTDGPTDAAGALVGPGLLHRVRSSGLNTGAYLEKNDSYHFFQKAGGLFVTGPTNTNVCDIQLLIVM